MIIGIVMGEVILRSTPYPEQAVVQVASLVSSKKLKWLLPSPPSNNNNANKQNPSGNE